MQLGIRIIAVAALLLAGCGKNAPPQENGKTSAAAQSPPAASAKLFSLQSVFPAGEGRDMVLSTCGSCHSVVCSTRGQRTSERWDTIRKDHADKVTGQTPAELDTMFAYLKTNFNDTRPEPQVPADLAQQGCTPF
jgi:hypothetical protein